MTNDGPPWDEIVKWLRFIGLQDAKKVIDDTVSEENDEEKERDKRIAYELTDGTHSTREIATRVNFSKGTVSNWQTKWSEQGIVDKGEGQDKAEHLISLEDAGLECPEIPEPEEEDENDE